VPRSPGPRTLDEAKAASDSGGAGHRRWLVLIAAVFAVSRALYFWAGVRFNDWPLGVYWQYLDPFLLKRKLGESLLHLHGQPPLFNLYLGAALATGRERAVFVATFLLCGLAVYMGSFLLMRRLGASAPLAFALATWLAAAPAFVAYENWLFYSLPVAALLVLAGLAFARALRTGRIRDGMVFLALLAVVCLTRSLYHLVYLLAAVGLLALGWRDGRRALAAGALPVLLVCALYAKNAVLFGHFAASTWTGMSLAHLTTDALSAAETRRLVDAGTLSPSALAPGFARPLLYPRAYFDPPPATRVRALYWEEKTTGGPNYNHAAYIRISDELLRDSLWVIRHRPRLYLASVREGWRTYFRSPADLRFLGSENLGAVQPASDLYDAFFFLRQRAPGSDDDPRAPARYWGLILGLPIVFGVGLAAALGRGPGRGLDPSQRRLAGFLCFNIAYVAVVGNLLELGENNRFRFETDPLSVCLLGLALQAGLGLVRRKGRS
jgi:hypothetical protein